MTPFPFVTKMCCKRGPPTFVISTAARDLFDARRIKRFLGGVYPEQVEGPRNDNRSICYSRGGSLHLPLFQNGACPFPSTPLLSVLMLVAHTVREIVLYSRVFASWQWPCRACRFVARLLRRSPLI